MFIYQIIAIHSRPWSEREVMLFGSVIIAGALLLLAAAAMRRIKKSQAIGALAALAVGVLLSGTIEVSQDVFRRGLFELDDIMHNSLGCMIGCMAANAVLTFLMRRRSGDRCPYLLQA